MDVNENHASTENIKIVVEETKQESRKDSVDATYSNTSRTTLSESSMPFYKRELPYCLSVYSIISLYTKSCEKYSFLITEQTPTACTAYHTQKCSIKALVSCCLGKKTKLKVTGIRLIISNNSRLQCRIAFIKGLYGSLELINKVIEYFAKATDGEMKNSEALKYQQVIEEEEEELAITCKNESYSYYQFYKILSCEAYTLGKSVSEFCESFCNQYRNHVESAQLLPQPLISIQSTIESTIEALFSHYNYGKKSTEKVMVYCRPAVEKYIYTKLHSHLIEIYKVKYELEDKLIDAKRGQIQGLTTHEIMKFANLNEQFFLPDEEKPYEEAITQISKLNECMTPTEKLNCFMNFESAIKSCVVQYWKGQAELDSENAMHVAIYVVLISEVKYVMAEAAVVADYLLDKSEDEKYVIENFQKALRYLIM